MSSLRTPEQWRRVVFRARVSDRCKVVLLFLADRMRQDRRVSVPRSQIAAAVGKTERRVTEALTEAKAADLLDVVVRGQKGVTAVYVGLFPDVQGAGRPPAESQFSGSSTSPLNDAKTRPLNDPNQAFRGRDARPPLQETNPWVGGCGQGGSEEEATPTAAARVQAREGSREATG